MKKYLLVFALSFLGTVAFAQRQRATETYEHHQARVVDAVSNAYVRPLVVDLVIDKTIGTNGKVEHTWKLDKTTAEVALGGDLENIHVWGTYMTTKQYKCDIIVAATFNIIKDPNGDYELTVTGFAANYKNWKPAETSDQWWINIVTGVGNVSEEEKTAATRK